MTRLAFLASYNGSSAKAITEACMDGRINAEPVLLISNNKDANAFGWATEKGLKTAYLKTDEILPALQEESIDMVVLSGYMRLLPVEMIKTYPNKILNVHPAMLPKYGGKGMYGHHVHAAVKQAGDSETGITIHYVDEIYDNGEVIAQKIIPVSVDDNAADIEAKVKNAEPDFYIETLHKILG
jgi:phosphoribosylglycinamide formyltransferase-1